MTTAQFNLSSLNGTNGFVINGLDRYDESGWSVSGAGDVNGDGFDDLIIGAPMAVANGQRYAGGVTRAGESYVVFGSADGFAPALNSFDLNGTNGFVINGIDFNDSSGSSVSGAGDVNGDGIDDLIIGAPNADPNGNSGAGESYVVFGSADGFAPALNLLRLNGTNGFRIKGIDGGDYSGRSVSEAGDINGDGIDDLIIGASGADPNGNFSAGESYVVFGSADGFARNLNLSDLNGTNGFVINGIDFYDFLGRSVSGAGDINGDGINDLIVGAPNPFYPSRLPAEKRRTGESYVVFGSASEFAPALNVSDLNGTNGFAIKGIKLLDYLGFSVSGAGDVNGDGIDDIIVGAPNANPNSQSNAGESYVVFGSADGFARSLNMRRLNGTNGFVIKGIKSGDLSGFSVSGAGDVNGDGIDDLIIGAREAAPNSQSDAGESYVVFGSANGFAPALNVSDLNGTNGFVINGIDEDDSSGWSVSGAGDVNGDGFDDIIIGAPKASANGLRLTGESYVVFGSADGFNLTFNEDTVLIGTRRNDSLVGVGGDDRLTGKAGDDFLAGGDGDDFLIGGKGADTLEGGSGKDNFVFQNLGQGIDQIVDFDASADRILIRQTGFDLDLKGRLSGSRFELGSAARDQDDRFIYNDETGALLFDADGTGSQAAQTIAFLNPGNTLNASNIRIV